MRQHHLLAVVAIALALAASASARSRATQPLTNLGVYPFVTAPGAVADTDVDVEADPAQPTATIVLYVPGGYGANLSLPPGTRLGDAGATFRGGDAEPEGQGGVIADDPAKHTADACAPGSHAAVWEIVLLVGSTPVILPVYVDPASADVGGRAAYQLRICLDAATAAGLTLEDLAFDLPKVLTNPPAPGAYLWRALVTPYGTGNTADPTRTVEVQSLVGLPQKLSVTVKRNLKRHTVAFNGSVVWAAATPRSGVNVHIDAATTPNQSALHPFATTMTNSSGRFSVVKPLRQTLYYVVYMNFYFTTSCEPTLTGAPCGIETFSPPPPVFGVVKVRKK